MRFSLQLPTDRVDAGPEFVSGAAVAELARTAEDAGFDACFVTEHPFPPDRWLAGGGHHALDPWVALSFAAAATTTLRVHTNIAVLAYRNPFLTAKAAASLDVLSGGRLTLGVAAGYLEGEFAALGADFEGRNERTDEAIAAMRRAWSEQGLEIEGRGFRAEGNSMLPRPVQQPGPPIWVGGNSRRAIRRAVLLGDGWIPFPTAGIAPGRVRTAAIETLDDLAERIAYLRDYAKQVGREAPLEICFVPFGLSMREPENVDAERFRDTVAELAALGVGWLSFSLPGKTRSDFAEGVRRVGEVLAETR
ncbi:MAG: LLM class F420-dependent oxidoreductase [Myxococcota bacterium]